MTVGNLVRRVAWHVRTDAEFRSLGWRPGGFLLPYYYGRLRDRLPGSRAPLVRRFAVRHGRSGRTRSVYLRLSPGVGDWIVLRGVWIHQDYWHPRVRGCRTVLDVGANIGLAAVWFRELLPRAEIACVEPDPRNLPLARLNLAANEIAAPVLACAIAPRAGRVRLGIGADTAQSALDGAGPYRHAEFVDVEARRVPDVLDALGWPRVDLLKLDVEGLERDLFADAGDWLGRVGLVLFELHPNVREEEIRALLRRHRWMLERVGYRAEQTFLARPARDAAPRAWSGPTVAARGRRSDGAGD